MPGVSVRSNVPAFVAAFSLLPSITLAQSPDTNGLGTAISTQLRDTPFQSITSDGAAVISGPVGPGTTATAGTLETARIWGKSFGFASHVGADANGPAYSAKGIGGAVGIERLVLPNFLIGAAFGYTASTTHSAVQDVKADTISGALYAAYALGALELNGVAGVNSNDYEASRLLTVSGAPMLFRGPAYALGWSVYGDVGYRLQVPTAFGPGFVKPLLALNYSSLDRSASSELVSSGLALDYRAQTFNRFTSLAGTDFGITHSFGGAYVRPEFRVGWIHEYTDPSPPVFASLAGIPIQTRDPQPGRDGLGIGAQTTLWSRADLQLFVGYNGEFRSNLESHQGTVGLRYFW